MYRFRLDLGKRFTNTGDKVYLFIYLYLFICHTITITKRRQKKNCRKKWRGGLKETINLMLIRPPQLQFFEGGIKITAADTKYYPVEN